MSENKMDEVRKMLAEKIHVAEIDENKPLKDLGLDSLDVVEMCLSLEDKFGIQFPAEELSEFKTVGDLLKSIDEKFAKKQ